jgi:hypothetical protein
MKAVRSIAGAVALLTQFSASAATEVVVNREPLAADVRQRLEQLYQVEIRPGRYWYDKVSGAWGLEGGPMVGQVLPGLPIGGPLRQDASGGRTGVVINGRELHPYDVAALQRCVPAVLPGRYWVAANGVGGYEGAPPSFDLAALCAAAGRRDTLDCDGSGSCGAARTRGGVTGVISEGGGRGAVTYNGKYIMTPN